MRDARRAVARGLLKAAAAFGPIQLSGDERAYFASMLNPDGEPRIDDMPFAQVERRLSTVAPVGAGQAGQPID